MVIEMGVIDRPVETQIETMIINKHKIKTIDDIIAPSYQFKDIEWDEQNLYLDHFIKNDPRIDILDRFIRIEIDSFNYQHVYSLYEHWDDRVTSKKRWNSYIDNMERYQLKELCSDFGIQIHCTRNSSGNKNEFYNRKYKTSRRIVCYQTKPVFIFILEHVKRNLDEYDRLVKLYKMEIELDKELNELKEKMIDCLELTIQEIKEKKINELRQI